MKRILIFFVFISAVSTEGLAQTENNTNAVMVAQKIAKKLRDSLGLTGHQGEQLYQVNMDIHNQKQEVRQQNPPPDSLRIKIQRIEKKRDTLYFPILGEEKYQLYLQKKRNLVNNN